MWSRMAVCEARYQPHALPPSRMPHISFPGAVLSIDGVKRPSWLMSGAIACDPPLDQDRERRRDGRAGVGVMLVRRHAAVVRVGHDEADAERPPRPPSSCDSSSRHAVGVNTR